MATAKGNVSRRMGKAANIKKARAASTSALRPSVAERREYARELLAKLKDDAEALSRGAEKLRAGMR